MNTLVNHAVQALANVQGTGQIQAESAFEWAQNIGTEFQTTMQVLILAVAGFIAFFIMIKRKFTVASIFIGVLVGGGAVWVVFSGAVFAKDRITDTVETSSSRTVFEQVAPGQVTASGDLLPDQRRVL